MISFVIPLYNKEHKILTTLQSIVSNVDFECEIVVVDDSSTDNSVTIAFEFLKSNLFSYQLIQFERNYGRSKARNVGINAAKGEYIYLLDADDVLLPGVREITNFARSDYIHTFNYYRKSSQGNNLIKKKYQGFYDVLFMNSIGIYLPTSSSIMFNQQYKKLMKFDEALDEGEDLHCWLNANKTTKFYHHDCYTMMYDDELDYKKIIFTHKPLFIEKISSLGFDQTIYGKTLWISKKLIISNHIERLGLLSLEKLLRIYLIIKRLIPQLILRIT